MDCGYYIPGGGEHNCSAPRPKGTFKDAHVCAIKEACGMFKEKEDRDDLSLYPPIIMKHRKKHQHY